MSRPRVYLAGPCAGLTFEEAMAWRLEVAPRLEAMGFEPVLPLVGEVALAGTGKPLSPLGEPGVKGCHGIEIFQRDMQLLWSCEYVLASLLGAKRISIGTVFELAAHWYRALINDCSEDVPVVVMEPDNVHRHCFIEQSCYVVETMEQALAWFQRRAQ